MMRSRWVWHDDLRRGTPPVLCGRCQTEVGIAATDERSVAVNGYYAHAWYHVHNQSPFCEMTPPPVKLDDPWAAQRAIDAATGRTP